MAEPPGAVALVAGGGGFIGGHLVGSLLASGFAVRAIDIKPLGAWEQLDRRAENIELDLSLLEACQTAVQGVSRVYNLASDMGGMGFIEDNKALCMLSVLINTNLLRAARQAGVERYFFSSSACVYAADKQTDPSNPGLKESDAYPAMPEDGYGWEKLFSERLCRHFSEDFGLSTRVARFHNVYGPAGAWRGGREKAPAAICRKIAEAKLSGAHEIEIWGDGRQTRSFMYIDDCVSGITRIMDSEIDQPVNLGSTELVSIDRLVTLVEEIAGITCRRTYDLSAPQGVTGRNSDNTLLLAHLGWEPRTPLRDGLQRTFDWIYELVESELD